MAKLRCDNCGKDAPFKHTFVRHTERLEITKTVFFDDKDCLEALERKWLTGDRDQADNLLGSWGVLPLDQHGVPRQHPQQSIDE